MDRGALMRSNGTITGMFTVDLLFTGYIFTAYELYIHCLLTALLTKYWPRC